MLLFMFAGGPKVKGPPSDAIGAIMELNVGLTHPVKLQNTSRLSFTVPAEIKLHRCVLRQPTFVPSHNRTTYDPLSASGELRGQGMHVLAL